MEPTEETAPAPEPQPAPESAPKKRRRISWKLRLLFLSIPYLLFFGILFGIEIYVRQTRPYIPTLQVFVESVFPALSTENKENKIYEGDPWLSWKFIPNMKDANWSYTTFTTNSRGIRYDRNVGRKKKGTFRVLCMGDSVTFGYRVPTASTSGRLMYDRTHKPYAQLMEDRLRAANPGRDIEVIPLGVPGYTSHQGLAWLKRDIDLYDPDLVTICYGFNDTQDRAIHDTTTIPTDKFMIFQRWLMMRSQAMIYFGQWRAKKAAATQKPAKALEAPFNTRVLLDQYVGNILEMARIAKEHDAKVLVLGHIYRDRVHFDNQLLRVMTYGKALEQATKKEGIPYLLPKELSINGYPENSIYFGEIIHPNELGHRFMANAILSELSRLGLLGNLAIEQTKGERKKD